MNYRKLLLMLVLSFIIMYSVMFLNVDELDHIYLSTTRTYMALLMVLPISILMLLVMWKMYPGKRLNTTIIISSFVLTGILIVALRTQTPISDIQYIKAMIPHHSSAVMTSKNANILDPEVKKLSEQIIKSQEEEIAQMKTMLQRMEK